MRHSPAVVWLGLIGILACADGLCAQSGARRCRISSLVGTVKVRRGGSQKWLDARPNMPLREKDAVRTFVESQATVTTSEGSSIELGENATFEVAIFSQSADGARTTKTKILSGSVMTNVKKLVHKNSSFEFETPTATAAIRGTTVGFDVTSDQTSIKVYEGKVYVRPKGASRGAELQSNQKATVRKNQKDVAVETMSAEERDATRGDSAAVDSAATDSAAIDSASGDSAAVDSAATDTVTIDTVARATDSVGVPADTLDAPPADSVDVDPVPADTPEDTIAAETGDADSVAADAPRSLALRLGSPRDGALIAPSSQMTVSGTVSPADATVTIRGAKTAVSSSGEFRQALTAPARPGEYTLEVEASWRGRSKRLSRSFTVQKAPGALELHLRTPVDGARIEKPLIRVSGQSSPGAQVRVSGMTVPVNGDGSFLREIPIPDETGDVVVEVEAELDGESRRLTRTVRYEPSMLALSVDAPADNHLACDRMLRVSGTVRPTSAEVSVNGKNASVSAGRFSAVIYLPEESGEHDVEIEASSGGRQSVIRRIVRYEPARERRCNTDAPSIISSGLPFSTTQPRLRFSVVDRTPADEITVHKSIDGAEETETVGAKAQFTLELEPGNHEYRIFAEDLAGNRSAALHGAIKYLAQGFLIRMRKPAGGDVVRIPPGTPDGEFAPYYTVRFSVENVPDDDPSLLREVIVRNANASAHDREIIIRDPLDIDFDVDIGLARGTNEIQVVVRDVNDQIVRQTVSVVVR